ncbi:hypothetical protein [Streptomyces sp. NPDC002054]|uniref:hypothetical protein n=1 Tax=Streptomyces sp. NPDC002054 TaxID=3154663 RepID=UPI0033328B5A
MLVHEGPAAGTAEGAHRAGPELPALEAAAPAGPVPAPAPIEAATAGATATATVAASGAAAEHAKGAHPVRAELPATWAAAPAGPVPASGEAAVVPVLVHEGPAAGTAEGAHRAGPELPALEAVAPAGPVPAPAEVEVAPGRASDAEGRTLQGARPGEAMAAPAAGGAEARRTAPLARLLRWALGGLAAVDAVALGPAQASLTPLGSWAVWVKLEQICVAAQSPAGNIEQSAAAMLHGCARLTPGPARAEYRAWLAARPVGHAVGELLQAARGADALLRGLAFEALRVVGAPAEPEVRAAAREATLRPYALLWLAEHDGADPEDAQDVLTTEEQTWLWVDTAAAIADHGEAELLARHLDSAVRTTVPRLLDEVRAVGHPRTVQVLVALAAAHPDPALAKAVRRAAFQVHTGG